MTRIKILPPLFYKYFWEIDPKSLDIQQYRFYVISRLLEFGDAKACKFIVSHFRKKDILKVINKSREVSRRTRNFWHFYF